MKKILFNLCYITLFLSLVLTPLSLSAVAAEGDGGGSGGSSSSGSSGSGSSGSGGSSSGSSSSGGSTTPAVKVAGITLGAPSHTVEPTGTVAQKTLLITPTFIPGDFVPGGQQPLEWSILSSEPEGVEVVTLTPNPVTHNLTVTGVKPGKAVIRASVGDYHADWAVEVSGVTLSKTALDVTVNTTAYLTASLYGRARDIASSNWEWRTDDRSIVRVNAASGAITGVSEGNSTTITYFSGAYSASCEVTVLSAAVTVIEHHMSGRRMDFTEILSELRGDNTYLTSISVSPSQGTLYNGYVSEADTGPGVASTELYYFDGNSIHNQVRDITFIPRADFSGTAVINFAGYVASSGAQSTGEIRVTVDRPAEIAYSSEHGEAIHFRAENFSQYSELTTGRPVSWVSFSAPAAKYGYLYYNYSSGEVYESNVSADTRYYRTSNPSIDNVSFLPADGYEGSFTMTYRGGDTAGLTFSGSIRITVGSDGSDAGGALTYRVAPGKQVFLRNGDFSDASYDAVGSSSLSYIRITALPSSNEGVLWYDGDARVATGTSYYRSGSDRRRLDDISFAANEDFTGTVSVPFTGTTTSGVTFDGTIRFIVSDSGNSPLSYTGEPGERVYFDVSDFSDASYDETDRQLSYVRFTSLPSSRKGVLYYGRSTKVSTSNSFYRTGDHRLLEDVSFVAEDDYTGTLSIPFTGYNTRGERFSGEVDITISKSGSASGGSSGVSGGTAGTISYYSTGSAVTLRAYDFTSACRNLLPTPLAKVRITPPDSSQGKLYLDYASPSRNTPLRPGQECSVASLSQVTFLPRAGYSGAVSLYYVGTDQRGNTCGSTFQIQVSPYSYSLYFGDMGASAYAVQAVDFLRAYGITYGTGDNTFNPLGQMKRGDFVLMLSRAFSFPGAGTESFSDVPGDYHYAAAIASAKALGIVSGYADGTFRPAEAITRQDAGVMLYRCLHRQNGLLPGSAGNLAQFSDRGSVAPAAVEAMGALVREGVFTGDASGNLNPASVLNRAQMAAILHRALT